MNSNGIRVILCDQSPMILCGLQNSFKSDSSISIVGELTNVTELRNETAHISCDVVLLGWKLMEWRDPESRSMMKNISSKTKVLLFGTEGSMLDQRRALDAGVRGILSEVSTASQIKRALMKVAAGGLWVEVATAEMLLDQMFLGDGLTFRDKEKIKLISPREHDIIELVCRGRRNKQIALELSISENTVWHHMSSIFGKLEVVDRVGLVTFAFRHDLHNPILQDHLGERKRLASRVARRSIAS